MNVKQIISANPTFKKQPFDFEPYLNVAEFFCDSIQGEGINIGHPAAFLRLQGCTLSCRWCDSREVWRFGNPYSFPELFQLMEEADLINKFRKGQHLVLTGGSPLKQQDVLAKFLHDLVYKYELEDMYIEIENEAVLRPSREMISFVNCWNNSPKLTDSGNKVIRYNTEALIELSSLPNSWFKFVIGTEDEWKEIYEFYIRPGHIFKYQVILMPEGQTREEINAKREMVIDLAVREGVRYCTREHIQVWDKKTGV